MHIIKKLLERIIVFIGKDFTSEKFPKPFNQIEIWRVRRQINQINVQFGCTILYLSAVLVSSIVKNNIQ